jgi:hypothetical protein
VIDTPNHKQRWCDALPVRMRLLGWSEEACGAAAEYVHKVRQVYTGRAWYTYTVEVDRFLREKTERRAQTLVGHFPRRSQIGRSLNLTA